MKKVKPILLLCQSQFGHSRILSDGIWTGHDVSEEVIGDGASYSVVNGQVYWNDAESRRRVKAATMTNVADIGNIYDYDNVNLVKSVLDDGALFSHVFDKRNEESEDVGLEFEDFLTAVA